VKRGLDGAGLRESRAGGREDIRGFQWEEITEFPDL
jgi:hypothetical protein